MVTMLRMLNELQIRLIFSHYSYFAVAHSWKFFSTTKLCNK